MILRPLRCITSALLLTIAVGTALPVQALTAVARSFDELVQRADTIVIGTAVSARSVHRGDGHSIRTLVSFNDLEVLKGEVPSAPFELPLPGGIVGDEAQVYPGTPRLRAGTRYVLFIRGQNSEFLPLVGAQQGLFRIMRDANGRERVVQGGEESAASAIGIARAPLDAPTLDDFVDAISARLQRTAGGDPVP